MLLLQILCLSHSMDQLPFLEEHVVLTEDTTHSHDDWEATEVTYSQNWDLWLVFLGS